MSGSSTGKSTGQPHDVLSKEMGQLSVTSDKISTPALTRLKVRFESKCALVHYNQKLVIYASPESSTLGLYKMIQSNEHIAVETEDFENVLFDDLTSTLKNPMLQLEYVSFYFDEYERRSEHSSRLQSLLGSIGHQLSIKSCHIQIGRSTKYCSILPYLKPGVLEKIIVWYDSRGDTHDQDTPSKTLDQISLLEQWKQAKELELVFSYDWFPMKYAKHFKRIVLNEVRIISVWLNNLADLLAALNNLEYCRIATLDKLDTQILHSEVGKPDAPNYRTKYVSHCLIPNSYDYFEFMFFEQAIEIERKKSNIFNKALPPPKFFSDMPIDIVGLIIERSDYKEQLILRKVSRTLRAFIDIQNPSLRKLCVLFTQNNIRCCFNNIEAKYSLPNGFETRKYSHFAQLLNNDYEKIAFDDLASTLKNPKLLLENFTVTYNRYECDKDSSACILEKYKKMKDLLASINHQVSAKKAEVDFAPPSAPFSILPYLKPGVLERISISGISSHSDLRELSETMEQVALLEQWKQANELELEYGFDIFPMKYATHFRRIFLNPWGITIDQFVRFRDIFCTLENFEYCYINNTIDHYDVYDVSDLYSISGTPAPLPWEMFTMHVSHYSIPNSEYYLEITFFRNDDIKIEKKKNQSF